MIFLTLPFRETQRSSSSFSVLEESRRRQISEIAFLLTFFRYSTRRHSLASPSLPTAKSPTNARGEKGDGSRQVRNFPTSLSPFGCCRHKKPCPSKTSFPPAKTHEMPWTVASISRRWLALQAASKNASREPPFLPELSPSPSLGRAPSSPRLVAPSTQVLLEPTLTN